MYSKHIQHCVISNIVSLIIIFCLPNVRIIKPLEKGGWASVQGEFWVVCQDSCGLSSLI
jgi:hypothetical protein